MKISPSLVRDFLSYKTIYQKNFCNPLLIFFICYYYYFVDVSDLAGLLSFKIDGDLIVRRKIDRRDFDEIFFFSFDFF